MRRWKKERKESNDCSYNELSMTLNSLVFRFFWAFELCYTLWWFLFYRQKSRCVPSVVCSYRYWMSVRQIWIHFYSQSNMFFCKNTYIFTGSEASGFPETFFFFFGLVHISLDVSSTSDFEELQNYDNLERLNLTYSLVNSLSSLCTPF